MGKIALIQRCEVQYPAKEYLFRPSRSYPENPFPRDLSPEENGVYDMLREGFQRLELDIGNFGTSTWNPLREFISPGDSVLIKPNLVSDRNHGNGGVDCLYTHPSLVAAMLDYVCIALQGEGKIIVADAPVQACNFDRLIKESGYEDLIAFYQNKGVNISLCDLRGLVSECVSGLPHATIRKEDSSICVDLASLSAHDDLTEKQMEAARITQYDPEFLKRHHTRGKHEYLIAKELLNANVIINMPKPKTHRKAGVTSSLKNFVGINCRKECLPHHRIGDHTRGGDEYLNPSWIKRSCACLRDKQNHLLAVKRYRRAEILRLFIGVGYRLADLIDGTARYRDGSWYGNDTIWRTIVDLNRIVLYADSMGKIRSVPQRKILCAGDMIVVGEKEGPLAPSPKQAGIIAIGENCVCFDEIVAAIMGMNIEMIPSIKNARRFNHAQKLVMQEDSGIIVSNNKTWNGKRIKEISYSDTLKLVPSNGWKGHIENRVEEIKA